MTNQSPKAVNLLRIYNRLRQSPITLDVLYLWTQRVGIKISRRSLYRYLDDLEKTVHFQGEQLIVYEGENNKKVWKIEFDKSSASFNQYDINTHYLIKNFLPNAIAYPRKNSIEKFDKVLYESLSKSKFQMNVDVHNGSFIKTNFINGIYTEQDHILLEDFIWAIQNHRKIKVESFELDPQIFHKELKKDIVLCPLKLIYHFGLIYIGTYWEEGNEIIIVPYNKKIQFSFTYFEFNPAKTLILLDNYLVDHFGIAANFNAQIYDIELELSKIGEELLSNMQWHESQRFKKLENGNTMLYLRCGINRELVGFIFYFLDNLRVKSPNILQKYLQEKLDSIKSNYLKKQIVF